MLLAIILDYCEGSVSILVGKLKEGKHVMCVMNVLRAKLVHRMFSVIKRDTEYTKEYKPAC